MAIRQRRDAWESEGKRIGFLEQSKALSELRDDRRDWRSLGTPIARGALRRVDRAFQSFFRRCRNGEKPGYPRFRSEGRYTTIEIGDVRPAHIRRQLYGAAVVKIKGLPRIEIRADREIPEDVKMIRITRRPVGCTVDFVVPRESEPLPESRAAVGIDMGVRKRLTLSNGQTIPTATTDWPEIRRRQRAISRCRKGSWRRRKRVRELARVRRREAVRNRNACHRITTGIVKRHGLIAVEALKIKAMANAVGRQRLNRQIHDQTWGILRSQLRYKAEWAGREFVEVNPGVHEPHMLGVRYPRRSRKRGEMDVRSLRGVSRQGRERRDQYSQGR